MDWWGIAAILVVGAGIVVYGYFDDRRKTRERDAAMEAPPKRDIPKFQPTAEPPQYLTELQARTRPERLAKPDLNDKTRKELKAGLASAPTVPAGVASERFVTDSSTGWAVASEPMVAICADRVDTIRELLPLLERAQRAERPLVIAAPGFSSEVLDTLAANTIQGKEQCLPVVVTAEQSEELAGLTLAQPLAHSDLQAGWAPDEALGTIGTWISDRKRSWLIS